MNKKIEMKSLNIKSPEKMGSYKEDDCIFLLKDVSELVVEQDNETREAAIQKGTHYSEMLAIEYIPKDEYVDVFLKTLKDTASKIAQYIAIVSEIIIERKGKDVILVSLARAGTPIGVLIKRYIKYKYNVNLPHYSISIIRDKGIDENAMIYMINKHKSNNIQFIDGWTGKGVISKVLAEATEDFKAKYDIDLDPTLAVLADSSHCSSLYGTREDFIIPSSCLNSNVSGLVSRTFLSSSVIGEFDFHGAKYYKEWEDCDYSNLFIDEISQYFKDTIVTKNDLVIDTDTPNLGLKFVEEIQKEFNLDDINLIKPGIGETTRVLLRRVPWKILVDDINNPNLKHIILLAKNKNVPIIEYKNMTYACCGIIKTIDQ